MSERKTIFLVDDDDDDRMMIRAAIGQTIPNIEVESGADLLKLLTKKTRNDHPALILMDMNISDRYRSFLQYRA